MKTLLQGYEVSSHTEDNLKRFPKLGSVNFYLLYKQSNYTVKLTNVTRYNSDF